MTQAKAKQLIEEIITVGRHVEIASLAQSTCPRMYVDFVPSCEASQRRMSLPEAEANMDVVIRKAFLALTGKAIPAKKDPVGFINGEK